MKEATNHHNLTPGNFGPVGGGGAEARHCKVYILRMPQPRPSFMGDYMVLGVGSLRLPQVLIKPRKTAGVQKEGGREGC